MEVRHRGIAGLRRAARDRSGFVALACALYLAAGVSAAWPAVLHVRSDFLSGGAPGHGEASPGDHLQTLYHWWLVGQQVQHGHAPWLDPYSFRPEADPQPNFPGWPFGFVYWPLGAALGLVVAWNVMQLLIYVLAGLLACAWLREVGLPRGPSLVGGLAFALAPYRVAQSVGHMLGPISVLLPLALLAVERARRGTAWWFVVAGFALASIPLSGQVHLALGAIPFFLAYSVVRLSGVWGGVHSHKGAVYTGTALAVFTAVGAGILVRQTVIVSSTQGGGRSLTEVRLYSARWADFVARNIDHARSEQFVYLGWATPMLALVGLAVLLRGRRFGLAALLGLGALVPLLLAVGTRLPVYTALWHALPPFRFPRVPERLLPIACLCIAGLVAFALARRPSAVVAMVAAAVLFVDLHARVYGRSAPGDPAVVRGVQSRLLELPVFDPGVHYGSVYLWYDTAAQVQRPGGYSTTAPKIAKTTAERLERLNCGDWSDETFALLRRLGIRAIAEHTGLFVRNTAVPDRRPFAELGLWSHGYRTTPGETGAVRVYRFAPGGVRVSEPPAGAPVFCQGWYGETGSGRFMSETHAALWVYGAGTLRLRFAPSPLQRRFGVDEHERRAPTFALRSRRWHLITVDVQHLVQGEGRKVGLRLVALATSPSRGIRNPRTTSSP